MCEAHRAGEDGAGDCSAQRLCKHQGPSCSGAGGNGAGGTGANGSGGVTRGDLYAVEAEQKAE